MNREIEVTFMRIRHRIRRVFRRPFRLAFA